MEGVLDNDYSKTEESKRVLNHLRSPKTAYLKRSNSGATS
jgi:hypothetical protein